jgi:hypothetical protein
VATFAIPFGHLTPSERAFIFTPTTDPQKDIVRLANLYLEVGLDYCRSIANFEALRPLLEGRISMLGGYPDRLAACLLLMRKREKALAFTAAFADQHPAYFQNFASAFETHVRAEGR